MDLVPMVTSGQRFTWDETPVAMGQGLRPAARTASSTWSRSTTASSATSCACSPATAGKVTVVPATTSAQDILALKPDGVFLSNGPGDPAATGEYAVPVIREADRLRHADLRHLPRPPDARHRGRRQDHEDASGPSRREPSGQGPDHRQGRDHLDEPRLRGRQGHAAGRTSSRPTCRCSTARTAASR